MMWVAPQLAGGEGYARTSYASPANGGGLLLDLGCAGTRRRRRHRLVVDGRNKACSLHMRKSKMQGSSPLPPLRATFSRRLMGTIPTQYETVLPRSLPRAHVSVSPPLPAAQMVMGRLVRQLLWRYTQTLGLVLEPKGGSCVSFYILCIHVHACVHIRARVCLWGVGGTGVGWGVRACAHNHVCVRECVCAYGIACYSSHAKVLF